MNLFRNTVPFILDSLIVIINLSLSNTILPFLFISNSVGLNGVVAIVITLLYSVVRFGQNIKIPNHPLFFLFVAINCTCMMVGVLTDTMLIGYVPLQFACIFFYIFLYNLYLDYRKNANIFGSLKKIFVGYGGICLYSIAGTFILWMLISLLDINPLVNNLSDDIVLLSDNTRSGENHYYFPYGLAIMQVNDFMIRVPFIQKYGWIAGLFHEPQSMALFVTPFLFFILSKIYQFNSGIKLLFLLTFLLVCIQMASVTNLLLLSALLLVLVIHKNKNLAWLLIPIIGLGLVLVIISFSSFEGDLAGLVIKKLDNQDGSLGYSESTLAFAFTPKTLLGTAFYDMVDIGREGSKRDVGLIMFIINLAIVFTIVIQMVKIFRSKNENIILVGFGLLYFFIHSLKQSMKVFTLTEFAFFIFILSICYNYERSSNRKRKLASKTNTK